MKTFPWTLPLIATAAAVFAAVSVVRSHPRREATEPPLGPPQTPFPASIAAVGLVEPSSEPVAVGTALSGVVVAVPVRVGDAVGAGAPLFELDTRALRAERGVREASLAAARRRVDTANSVLDDLNDQRTRAEQLSRTAVISPEELERRRFAVRTAEARLDEARAEAVAAEAALAVVDTEIERATVRSPIAATVLQVNVRPGEYAAAGPGIRPLAVLGQLDPLHVRVDVDEHEGWRVMPSAAAEARLRGDARKRATLRFVRFEPLVIPKRSLTGDVTERVDTRVLQVIYAVTEAPDAPLFVGQQVDVFIAAAPGS